MAEQSHVVILPASQTRRGGLSALSPTSPHPFDFFVVADAQLPSLTSKKVMGSAGSSDLGVRRFSVTQSLLLRSAQCNRLDAALSDPPSDVLEIRRRVRLDLPQVEPAVDFDHHGTDACVAPVPTSRHQRSREGVVQTHSPPGVPEGGREGACQFVARVEVIGANADVRPCVRGVGHLVGQPRAREAVAVDHQASPMAIDRRRHGSFQHRVVRAVVRLHQRFAFAGAQGLPKRRHLRGRRIDRAHAAGGQQYRLYTSAIHRQFSELVGDENPWSICYAM